MDSIVKQEKTQINEMSTDKISTENTFFGIRAEKEFVGNFLITSYYNVSGMLLFSHSERVNISQK